MGWLIRFIHNRDLAAEGIMTAYVRHRVVLSVLPGTLESLGIRLKEAGLSLPVRSILSLASEVSTNLSKRLSRSHITLHPLTLGHCYKR